MLESALVDPARAEATFQPAAIAREYGCERYDERERHPAARAILLSQSSNDLRAFLWRRGCTPQALE